jgi:hypothetical protein
VPGLNSTQAGASFDSGPFVHALGWSDRVHAGTQFVLFIRLLTW